MKMNKEYIPNHPLYDYSIEIDTSNFPKVLKDEIIELEKYDKTRDWLNYDYHFDILEVEAKGCLRHNRITESEFKKLMRKYGWYCD